MSDPEDPTRRFLDQTVPRHDEWDGREPEDGPARPRHVQYPSEPVEPLSAKERRSNTIRGVAWGAASLGAFGAGAALSDDEARAESPEMDAGFGEIGSGL
ncbi:hypothetical protein [Actinophytocola algeriensis]|uniref:Uncharacterized protein n=1 Tax=Actinophytocola algeriensis TaxID=1768010 RepID=A0A7W7Q080_9PSEU|nr:hypothetical protein [Actinophytocola algeriensis]MBB4904585.1 hypothetical protein [Actinophytocola algeriensis]MBE1476556.1 hypothetical protein [Actinophytocola algeriensis]